MGQGWSDYILIISSHGNGSGRQILEPLYPFNLEQPNVASYSLMQSYQIWCNKSLRRYEDFSTVDRLAPFHLVLFWLVCHLQGCVRSAILVFFFHLSLVVRCLIASTIAVAWLERLICETILCQVGFSFSQSVPLVVFQLLERLQWQHVDINIDRLLNVYVILWHVVEKVPPSVQRQTVETIRTAFRYVCHILSVTPPLCIWLHLFRGAGHEKRRGEQLKYSLAFSLYIESFHVHSYQDQFIGPMCFCVFSLGLYFVFVLLYFVCVPHPFVFPWAVESSP